MEKETYFRVKGLEDPFPEGTTGLGYLRRKLYRSPFSINFTTGMLVPDWISISLTSIENRISPAFISSISV